MDLVYYYIIGLAVVVLIQGYMLFTMNMRIDSAWIAEEIEKPRPPTLPYPVGLDDRVSRMHDEVASLRQDVDRLRYKVSNDELVRERFYIPEKDATVAAILEHLKLQVEHHPAQGAKITVEPIKKGK